MTEIVMRRDGKRLAPANQIAEDDLATIPHDKDLLVTIRRPRNIKQFSLAWSLAQKVADACDWLHDKTDAMDYLLIRSRHVKYLTNPMTGDVQIVPKSIALASMKQEEFDRLFKRLTHIVLTEIMPGVSEGELKSEIHQMIGA